MNEYTPYIRDCYSDAVWTPRPPNRSLIMIGCDRNDSYPQRWDSLRDSTKRKYDFIRQILIQFRMEYFYKTMFSFSFFVVNKIYYKLFTLCMA